MWIPDLDRFKGPKYAAIADALCADIRNKRLEPGEKLPPQRELADELNVNFGTVTKAYALAAERGLVRGEVGRGTFVRKDPPSSTAPWPQEKQLGGRADMRSDFPCSMAEDPAFSHALIQLGQHPDLGRFLRYQPGSSLPFHLETASIWLDQMGVDAPPDRILITNGALHGGFLSLMAVTKPGDLVLTDTTTSPAIRSLAAMLHLRLKPVAMDEDGMIPEDLADKCQNQLCQAVYLIPNFHNPTARIMPYGRRKQIARIAEQFELTIVEDDVFGPLIKDKIPPLAQMVPELAFYVTSLSKAVAPGLRIGYAAVPDRFYQQMLTGLRITTWMASPLTAHIASQWIMDGTAQRLSMRQAEKIAQRQTLASRLLTGFNVRSHPFCPHMWLRLPPKIRESDAVVALGQKGIDVTPGEYFAVGPGFMPGGLRLCLGQMEDPDLLVSACRTIVRVLSQAPGGLGASV